MKDINVALKTFGLDEKEREVYLLLLKNNWITALQLSRLTAIKRPTLYRVLEELSKKGLIETQVDDKTTHYSASDPKQFETLIFDQKKRTQDMQDVFSKLQNQLAFISLPKSKETAVHFYRGIKGLQYMELKKANAKNSDVLIIDTEQWTQFLGNEFAENIRNRIVENYVNIRELQNPINTKKINSDRTVGWTKNKEYLFKYYQHREISEKIINITQDLYIFNDTIHMHGYRENDLMGIEIINHDYAQMFRQLFEFLWSQARIVDKFGGKK